MLKAVDKPHFRKKNGQWEVEFRGYFYKNDSIKGAYRKLMRLLA